MQRALPELRRRGVQVAAVGQGTGEEAARFCRGLGIDFPCLGDPGREAYRAFALARDGWWNVTLKPFLEDPKLAFDRIRRASLRGSLMRHTDVLQLGGVVVVDTAGAVRTLHRARRTDDWPPMSQVIAELDRLGLSRSA